MIHTIDCDHNATSPLRPEVATAYQAALHANFANPSSVHQRGVAAKRVLEAARRDIATAFAVLPSQLLFTSGGTEANATVLYHYQGRPILVSTIEHPSVRNHPAVTAEIPVKHTGQVCLKHLEQMLQTTPTGLVSVMLANNETGIFQPLKEIVALAHAAGWDVHTDAAQVAGRLPIDFMSLNIDWLTFGAHKAGAPLGIGAIIGRGLEDLKPLLVGGSQEMRRRAGTENIPSIAALAALFRMNYSTAWQGVAPLRDAWENLLPSSAIIIGQDQSRLPNTSLVIMPNVKAETQVMAFDLEGIAVSAGAACSSGKVTTSPVLKAMGYDDALASCAVRFSFGIHTTIAEIQQVAAVWQAIYQRCAPSPCLS